jgi:ABC-type bacteriocin/lantibiotic exporter with double-glycine peptidase domain
MFIKSNMKKIFSLLNNKVKFILFLSLPLGVFVGFIEVLLAISMNDLLISTKLIDGEKQIHILSPFIFIIIIAAIRFALVFFAQINNNLLFELVGKNIRHIVISNNYKNEKEIGLLKSQNILNVLSPKIAEFLHAFSECIIQIFIFLIIYIHLLNKSFELTLYSSLIFLIISTPMIIVKKKISFYSNEYQNRLGQVLNKLFKDLRNLNFLKIVGSLTKEKIKINNINDKTIEPYIKYILSLTFINQLPNFFAIFLISLILVYNGNNNILEKSLLVPFLYLMLRSIISFSHIINAFGRISFTYPFANKLSKISYKNNKFYQKKNKKNFTIIKNFSLSTKNLGYGYDKILNSPLSLEIPQGSFCLFSGKSGSGKTTLILTLIGIVKKKRGKIFWDKKNLDEINQEILKKNISYCGTDPFLIEGTILQNLTYGLNKNIEKKKIVKILKLCKCDFLLNKKNNFQLNHFLKDEGSGLSSGQKQRIAIARAILSEPKIIILDEATVNIDEKNEFQIISNIKKYNNNCTILAISHRESLKKFADQVINLG